MQRFKFRDFISKADTEWEIDGYVAKILSEPAQDEDAVVARVRKAGATDEETLRAAMANRALAAIVAAWDGNVPAEVVKAIDGKLAKSTEAQRSVEKPAPTTAIKDDDIPPWFLTEIERQREKHYPGLENTSDDEIMRALIGEHPEWGDDRGVVRPENPQSVDEILKKHRDSTRRLEGVTRDLERSYDRKAGAMLDDAAKRIRKQEPNLTAAQAFTKALQNDPSLYDAYRRDELRKSGYLQDSGRDIEAAQAMEDKLDEIAARVLKDEPGLTRAQAIAKAYADYPRLFEELR
jgi:hypothetical protein